MTTEQIESDNIFLADVVGKIPGWLEDFGARATMRILRWQESNVSRGSLFEIGIFQGKYFSLLLRSAKNTHEHVFALDTFQYADESHVKAVLESAGFTSGYTLKKCFSTDMTSASLYRLIGGTARFISIDGSHEKEDVHWDLCLAEQLVAADGIVSVDDFLNPVTLGVNEGVHAFFAQFRNLEPVLYTSNKLFLARPGEAPRYRAMIEEMLMSDEQEPIAAAFRARMALGRHHAEQNLWGKKLLVA